MNYSSDMIMSVLHFGELLQNCTKGIFLFLFRFVLEMNITFPKKQNYYKHSDTKKKTTPFQILNKCPQRASNLMSHLFHDHTNSHTQQMRLQTTSSLKADGCTVMQLFCTLEYSEHKQI